MQKSRAVEALFLEVKMVDYEVDNGIAFITLNRPERLNAYTQAFFDELPAVWKKFREDEQALVAIITGAGEKAFTVGYDLSSTPFTMSMLKRSTKIVPTCHDIWKPIIAAIKGYCVAGGFWIASGCDLRVAADDAEFGIPEAKWSLFSILNVPEPLYQNLPPGIALEMLLLGERISARRAYEIGFLNRIVPREQVMKVAVEIAEIICANGPLAVRRGKEIFYKSRMASRKEIAEMTWKFQEEVLKSEDSTEAMKAYSDKRKPMYKGV